MNSLNKELEEEIQNIFSCALDLYNDYKTDASIAKCEEGLKKLPGKAYEYDMGYTFVNTICEIAFQEGHLQLVEEWLPLYLKCDEKLRGFGNSELMAGKIELQKNNKNRAMYYFKLAHKLSSGRIWSGKKKSEAYLFYKDNK